MTEQYSFRMWMGTLEMTVHVVQVEDAMPSIDWITREPVIVRATVEVNDPSAGSDAVRVVLVQDYAIDGWSEKNASYVAWYVSANRLRGLQRIEPVISGEEW